MKASTFNTRTAKINKNSKGYKYALELLTTGVNIFTCHTSGTGRFLTNQDYTNDTIFTLQSAGLIKGKDFVLLNDSPRGGKTGNHIKLTAKGKRKMITE